jgi:DNA-binding CsgD family transcriptional regulator
MRGQPLSDTQLLLELVGEAYSFEDLPQFRAGIVEVLNRVVPSHRVGYNEISPDDTFAVMLPEYDVGLMPRFAALAHENPLIERFQRTGDGRPYRISDVADQATFHATALYKEFYRPMGVETQVAFTLPSRPQLIVGLALTREREDFSDREVQILALARPHLIQAYRNAQLRGARAATLAALEAGLDALARHIVVLDRHGCIEFATDGARRLLDDSTRLRDRLPAAAQAWISEQRHPRSAAEPYLLRTSEGGVLVRLLPHTREDQREVLLLEGAPGELSLAALRGLGLTPRQAQTLRLLALDHSPAQAATQMGIARRTLDKHLQQIYAKLGTPTLAQATAVAWAAVGVEREEAIGARGS